jgi:hypothetical protein
VGEDVLNPFATRIWARLVLEYPEWQQYRGMLPGGDLECAVPAPSGSHAGHLILFTSEGRDLWVRYSPPQMCYPLDDEDEMLSIVRQLLRNEALFVVTRKADEWTGTTLIRPGQEPDVPTGEVANVVSWSGALDRTVNGRA